MKKRMKAAGILLLAFCFALLCSCASKTTTESGSQPLEMSEKEFDIDTLHCFVDLHLHLDGAISVESARDLAALQGIAIPDTDEEIAKRMRVSDDCSDLNEFLEKFDFPCSLLQTKEGLQRAVENLLAELKDQGVMYAEIRFAPQKSTDKGLTQEEAVLAAIEGIKNAEIKSNLILCCMREDDNEAANLETVELGKKYYGAGVCAIDLAGAEALFPTKDFRSIFALAKSEGVPFTIHAGEADGPESVWDALDFGAARIGHGIRSIEDEGLVEHLASNQIPLEICPTSNVCTAVYSHISEYPFRQLLEDGLYITVNTDDPAIENTDIKNEYRKLISNFSLTESEVEQLFTNSVNAAFVDDSVKKDLLEEIAKEFNS